MTVKNDWLIVVRVVICFFLLVGITTLHKRAAAQSIYLKDVPDGAIIMGGVASAEDFSGSVTGFGYSVNGSLDLVLSYNTFSAGDAKLNSVTFSSNILFAKQYDGDALNFELMPSVQRSYTQGAAGEVNQTVVSLGVAVSRDLIIDSNNEVADYFLIPRLSLLYGNVFIDGNNTYPSEGMPDSNFYTVAADLTGGIRLTDNSKFIINPGYTYNIKDETAGWALTGGFLFY